MAQQALGSHQDQRFAEIPVQLPAQNVEELGGGRRIGHLHVLFGAQLQKALRPGAGVFRSHPLVPVRQQQHQPAHALPLGLAAGDVLVDNHLGAVDKIPELRLPQHQPARVSRTGAVLETEHRQLREHGVEHHEFSLVPAQVRQRQMYLSAFDVVPRRHSVGEGTALAVLADQPHRRALQKQ